MVDLANVVYYPKFFDIAHRFFEESWEKIWGVEYSQMILDLRLGFPVVTSDADFVAPLRYGDYVTCKLWIEEVGTSSCVWQYRFTNQSGDLVWKARIVTVCVDLDSFDKRNIPTELADSLRSCGED